MALKNILSFVILTPATYIRLSLSRYLGHHALPPTCEPTPFVETNVMLQRTRERETKMDKLQTTESRWCQLYRLLQFPCFLFGSFWIFCLNPFQQRQPLQPSSLVAVTKDDGSRLSVGPDDSAFVSFESSHAHGEASDHICQGGMG